jgi:hypothetical protein
MIRERNNLATGCALRIRGTGDGEVDEDNLEPYRLVQTAHAGVALMKLGKCARAIIAEGLSVGLGA